MKKSSPWFSIQANASEPARIEILDEIGLGGVTAKDFIAELNIVRGRPISLLINSPGGSVFDGLAIYNALRSHGAKISVRIMGVAASAASVIAMAGNEIAMPENAFMMVHNPAGDIYGNASELREFARLLDGLAESLVGIYVSRTRQSKTKIKQLLDDETWMNASEAKALGFADRVEAEFKAAARFDTSKMPAKVMTAFKPRGTRRPKQVTTSSIWEARRHHGQ